MKLPIKKKWFDEIKKGEKDLEWRDAHITFVCEETGETLRRDITSAIIINKSRIRWESDFTKKDLEEMFEDDMLIGFALKSSKLSLNSRTIQSANVEYHCPKCKEQIRLEDIEGWKA